MVSRRSSSLFGSSCTPTSIGSTPRRSKTSCFTLHLLSQVGACAGELTPAGASLGKGLLQESGEVKKSPATDLGLAGDGVACRLRIQHPGRDLQTTTLGIHHRDRTLAGPRRAGHLEVQTPEGVEGIVDPDLRTYGLMAVVAFIPIFMRSVPGESSTGRGSSIRQRTWTSLCWRRCSGRGRSA
jgi:hypothetical protein